MVDAMLEDDGLTPLPLEKEEELKMRSDHPQRSVQMFNDKGGGVASFDGRDPFPASPSTAAESSSGKHDGGSSNGEEYRRDPFTATMA